MLLYYDVVVVAVVVVVEHNNDCCCCCYRYRDLIERSRTNPIGTTCKNVNASTITEANQEQAKELPNSKYIHPEGLTE